MTFRERNLGKKDYQKTAKDLESARKSWVADATGSVRQWQAEAGRINELATFVREFENKQDSATEKAALQAMEKVAVPMIKQKWANEIDKGREIWATRDSDKAERFNKLEEEVNEAVEQQQGNYEELWEAGKKKVLQEHRDSLLNLSHFERMGVARARLTEAANGFGDWRIGELQTSEDTVYDDEGTPFLLKDYKDPSLVGAYEAASSHLYAKYYMQNKGDFTAKYLNAKFVPELMKQEVKQKSEYYAQVRKDNSNQRIDNHETIFFEALKTGDVDQIAKALQTSHVAIPALFDDLGAKEGGNVAWRKSFVLASLQRYAAQNPNADVKKLIAGLKKGAIKHPSGTKSLLDLYPDEFSEFGIKQMFNKAKADQASLLKSADANAKIIFEDTYTADRNEAWEKGEVLDDKYIANALRTATDLNYTAADIQLLDTQLRLAPMSDVATTAFLETEAKNLGGQISSSQVLVLQKKHGLSQVAIEDLKERKIIVDEPFLTGDPKLIAEMTNSDTRLEAGIKLLEAKYDNPNVKLDERGKYALKILKEEGIQGTGDPNLDTNGGLYSLATNIYNQNQQAFKDGTTTVQLTKAEALEQATGQLLGRLEALNANPTLAKHKLYNQTKKGFVNITHQNMSPIFRSRERDNITLNEMEQNVLNEGIAGLYNRPPSTLTIDDFHIGPTTGNTPGRVMQLAAAADETGKYDPWDFMNRWREVIENDPTHPLHAELKAIPNYDNGQGGNKPIELQLLREKIPAKYIYELTNWKDSKTVLRRAIKAANIAEVKTIVLSTSAGYPIVVEEDFKGELTIQNNNYIVTPNGKVISHTEFLMNRMKI